MAKQDVGQLVYEVSMDVQELMEARQKIDSQLYGLNKSANAAGQSIDRLERKTESLGGGFTRLASVVKGYITIQAALKLIEIADDMTMLQARVTRLSGSLEEAKNTMASLSTIAANTGNSLASTEKLWETLTSSLKEAGATNSQVLMLTDTLQKIGVVGGSSAEEMSNALRQFGQSIAGGIVRAEEFNSVLENMPELARQMAAGLGLSLGQLRQRMLEGKLTAEDALNAIQKQAANVNTEFDKMPVTVDRAKNSLDVAFKNMINDLNQSIGLTQQLAGLMQAVANNLNFYNKNVGDSSRMPKLIELQKKYNDELSESQHIWESDKVFQIRRGQAAFELKKVEQEIAHIRAKSVKDLQASSKPIEVKSTGAANTKQDDLIKKSQRRIELSKREGEARARLQAQYDAEDAGIKSDDPRVKSLQDQYAETYRNTQAQRENTAEGKKSASQAERNAAVLEEYRQKAELSADSTSDLSRKHTILAAKQKLTNPTPEQVAQVEKDAAAAWDKAAALKAQNAVPELKENEGYSSQRKALDSLKDQRDAQGQLIISQEQYNAASEQLEQSHQVNLAKIRAEQNAGVTPLQDAQGAIDPVQALANENARKLELIKQFETEKGTITANGLALMNAANTQYEQQRTAAQWELLSQQSLGYDMLTSAVDAFAGNASNALTGLLTGSMNAEDAMRSLGNTILNSVINSIVQVGVEMLKNFIIGQSIGGASTANGIMQASLLTNAWTPAAYAASVATGGAAAKVGAVAYGSGLATTQALGNVAGARKNGGPVSAGSMYQVGEGGMPEIYKASSGKQYMIPGDNGSVISNKDMQGGGAGVSIYIENYSSGAGVQDVQTEKDASGGDVIRIAITDIQQGGPLSQAISNFHNAPRRAGRG